MHAVQSKAVIQAQTMTSSNDRPLVSVVTPVYNTEEYLAECIESVLAQSYPDFEYIILDNCSTDDSLEIAERYAREDPRIRVLRNKEFLNQVKNYNESVRHISEDSRYCKIVQADDWLFPDCLEKMVALAASNPKVGIVSAYTLLDFGDRSEVYLTGLPYSANPCGGREICRRFLLDGLFVFGSPTANLFRADIVRQRPGLYPEDSVVDDIGVCLEVLQAADFGFVYQVLTYSRRYNDSIMSVLKHYNLMTLSEYISLHKYGHSFLSEEEFSRRRLQLRKKYHRALGECFLRRHPKEFWDFQKFALEEIGETISTGGKILWAGQAAVELALNPKLTLERLFQSRKRKIPKNDKVRKFVDI